MQASQAKDSTVTLPRAVLRRSAAIEARLLAARNEPKADPADPNAPPVDPSAQAATPSEPALPADPPQPAADPRENDPAYWRQRFNVTAGVLKAERTQRQGEAGEFNRKLTELQEQVRTLQAAATPTETKLDLGQFFTPEQIEQFGEEQCEAMAKAAKASAQAAVKDAIEAEVKPLREERERTKAQTIEDRKREFTDKLAELVPNYAEIDTAEDWLAWLAQEDEATGLERQDILNRHIAALNAPKVAKVFMDFLKTKAPKPTPPVVGKGSGAGPSGDAPPTPPAGSLKAPTDAEVKAFFTRAAIMQGRMPESERLEFEARMKLRTAAR
jgi:hypothetical protein